MVNKCDGFVAGDGSSVGGGWDILARAGGSFAQFDADNKVHKHVAIQCGRGTPQMAVFAEHKAAVHLCSRARATRR